MPRRTLDPSRTERVAEAGELGQRRRRRVHGEHADPALERRVEPRRGGFDLVVGRLGRRSRALGQRRFGIARVHDEQVGVAERGEPGEQVVAHLDAVAGARDDAGERGARLGEAVPRVVVAAGAAEEHGAHLTSSALA